MNIAALLDAYRPGHSLEQAFYCDPGVFARDMDLLTGRWLCVGHVSELPAAGDWLTAELGRESAIVTRGADGAIHAMANVCRHRGSRICTAPHGHAMALTCPYHGWSYHLDGRLRRAPEMAEGFDPAAHGLAPLPLKVIGGLIFLSFTDNPPAIDKAAEALSAMTGRHGWDTARIAARKTFGFAANWKLAVENYHECYHCAGSHTEFSALHALSRPGNRRIGERDAECWGPVPDGQEVFRVMHSSLADGVITGSRDGKALAPPMGAADTGGECVFAELGLLSAFLAYADHGVIYRFIPREPLRTEMEVIWLVRGDAEAGRDWDPAALTWLWDVTSAADKTIIENNQAGVLSRAYRPGPFSTMEPATRMYVERYVAEMARLV
jgi:phenylpropionate dioxygenase-like ring-hydroxylating dioxygenase large terminal subunit